MNYKICNACSPPARLESYSIPRTVVAPNIRTCMFTIDFYNKRKHREATKIIKLYHQYNDLHQVSSDTMSSTAEFHKHRAEYATQYRENLNRDFSNWLSTTSFIAHDPSISIGTVPVGFFKALFYSQQLTSLYERPMGSVMSCGLNEGGLQGIPQLDGDKGTDQSTDFIPINNLPSNIIQLVAGSTYSLALSDEGILYAWGDNGEGQCGRAWWNSEPTDDTDYANILSPYMIELDERIIAISAGDAHTLALSLHGSCYFFGTYRLENGSHLRDIGKNPNDPLYQKELQMLEEKDEDQENEKTFPKPPHGEQFLPIKISIPENVIKIDSGSSFNAVLTRDGVCYTWGVGDFFGRNITGAYDLTPKSISWFDEDYLARSKYQRIVRDMACGGSHILVVAQDSNSSHWSVYSAGNNLYGQLGLGFRVAGQTTEEKPKSLTKVCINVYTWIMKKYVFVLILVFNRFLYVFVEDSFFGEEIYRTCRRRFYTFSLSGYHWEAFVQLWK